MNREEKKALKRQEIYDTAMTMFLARGFENVTTQEIADAVDIAKKTLFQYFPSKEDIVFDDEDELLMQIIGVVKGANPWQDFLTFIRQAESVQVKAQDNFKIVAFIEQTPALQGRLLQMWENYELTIAKYLNAASPLENRLLAQQMVTILRLSFYQGVKLADILAAQRGLMDLFV
ncbi:putative transcriptional regulator [Weissella oryzae SG25]|uniref:Putative transcriptional regulator n=1 Tax=Weissella oryzae (strain DSM 25784 / JCM 18191 / LMG 30913 / SG25) TaxID=1329250 RepID=A0A069CV86_WEIOS|nr:TetR family transcriptional regulator [Weissella oryzae]GAK31148.1 putative transcriptional regulator [Weissella oryzae SG25]